MRAAVFSKGTTTWVSIDGRSYALEALEPGAKRAPGPDDAPFATSPMTGVLAKLTVEPGQHVERGDELFVVEAMKMEYVVRAPRDIVVEAVQGEAGARVAVGDIIVRFGAAA